MGYAKYVNHVAYTRDRKIMLVYTYFKIHKTFENNKSFSNIFMCLSSRKRNQEGTS